MKLRTNGHAGATKGTAVASAKRKVLFGRHRGATRVRLEAIDWVDAGIQILVREGIEHVKVDRLSAQLGVTKGSFYWHFKDRADLHAAILDRWLQKATIAVGQRVERESAAPHERLFHLLELPFWSPKARRAADLELAIQAWARRSALARRAVTKVDALRVEYLTQLFSKLNFSAASAAQRAHLAYALMRYLGQLRYVDENDEHCIIQAGYECMMAEPDSVPLLRNAQRVSVRNNGRSRRLRVDS